MATSTHQVALFEEGFMLVGVDKDDIESYGEEEVWDAIQEHPWVIEKGFPVVIVYDDENGEKRAYGDTELVNAVTTMNFDEIQWGHELSLEWAEDGEGEGASSRAADVTDAVAYAEVIEIVEVEDDADDSEEESEEDFDADDSEDEDADDEEDQ
ncbi:MAG: hypothetical protein LC737_04725 [Chloroflexi bacterium]|nr:hypothetical protein [Chloroflexota bacterium]